MDHIPPRFSSIPFYPLLYPGYSLQIQPLPRFTAHIASKKAKPSFTPAVYICREDTNSGLSFGGNKIRKLEYLIPDIIPPNTNNNTAPVTTLVTTGGIQSNHQRAVAAVAAHLGLKCVLVPQNLVARKDQFDEAVYQTGGNVQLTKLLGAEVLPVKEKLVGKEVDDLLKELRSTGEVPYWIPSGSSTHAKGGLGYAKWAFELEAWESKNKIRFSTIVVACASGSTLGGMIAGFKYIEKQSFVDGVAVARRGKKVVGVDVWASEDENQGKQKVLEIARRTGLLIGLEEGDIVEKDVIIERRWNAGSYGRCDEKTREAMRVLARTEGILTDPVYTGKAAAGLIGIVGEEEFVEGDNVLFVHTGGQAALCAYPGVC